MRPYVSSIKYMTWFFALAFMIPVAVSSAAPPASNSPTVYRAADFTNSLGVGIHAGNVTYQNIPKLVNDLSYIGFKHVRDSIGGTTVNAAQKFPAFESIGVMSDAIFGSNKAEASDPNLQKAFLDQYAKYIESLEGPNEPEYTIYAYQNLTGIPAAAAIQKALYTMVKNDPNLVSKSVLNISFAKSESTLASGNLSPFVDFNNVHAYPEYGAPPYTMIPVQIRGTKDAPGKPFIVTETGYPTYSLSGPRTGVSTRFVTENVQAKYLLDAALDNFTTGVRKTYLYDLFDDKDDPQNTDKENHFGMFHNDGTPKIVATSFHNLFAILSDKGGSSSSFIPNTLSFSLEQSLPATTATDIRTHNVLLQKQGGVNELILWGEPAIWNGTSSTSGHESTAPTNNITVNLNKNYAKINVYDPMQDSAPINSYSNVKSITVPVTDHPMVVEIVP